MPAKSKARGKGKKDAASFEKFKAVFFEEFLWRNDGAVKVDEVKLIELFERCFESKDYPTLNKLRKTVSFLASFTDKGVKYEHSVHYHRDFCEVSDFFEENLEGSFKAGLDACRKQSHLSKPNHSIRAQEKEKPLPDEPQELVWEADEILKQIYQLRNKQLELHKEREQILAPFPKLKVVWEDERTGKLSGKPVSGAVKVRMYLPRSRTVETVRKLPTKAMTEDEKKAQKDARKLFLDYMIKQLAIEKAEQRLRSIEKRAEKFRETNRRLRLIKEAVLENQKLDLEEFEVHDKENFTWFTFRGKQYHVRPPQGQAIKLLYEAGKAGRPDVPLAKILEVLGRPRTSKVKNSFRRTRLWNTLLISKKRNTRRLSIFS